ncbi:MAG: ATP-dependent RecD-like DNA helicase [Firmicutes bacterium]|nr:ATP-dependent RecD-like DNA helicase [Bacillota bacterium]
MKKRGRLADIIFRNNENFYTVAVFENDEEMDQFTGVGNMPEAVEGLTYELTGEWKTHARFGEQFSIRHCVEVMPDSTEAVRQFLMSGVFRGVKRKMADRIIRRFGEATLEILGEEPEKLEEIDGIGKKTAAKIAEDYRNHMEFAEIAIFFANHGISSDYAMKMYKKYKSDTVKIVMENPYRLVSDIRGFGFRKADEVAGRLGFDHESQFRIQSGLHYVLAGLISRGNTCAPLRECCLNTAELLGVSSEQVEEAADFLAMDQQVRIVEREGRMFLYPSIYYRAESRVASRIISMADRNVKALQSDVEGLIRRSEADAGIELEEKQKEAVRMAAESGICVITGGPGTGKTTIINTMIDVFEQCGMDVALAAPTGRAAKRMTEASGHEARTIHRLLEYSYSEDEETLHFGRNADNPLDEDVIIVDEMSMVDILLMDALMDAIPGSARLIMAGDADQLPSVGAGRVLGDILDSELVKTVRLTEVYRQSRESMIIMNAHSINRGEYPQINQKDTDFFMIGKRRETEILDTILDLCEKRLPGYYTELDPIRDIQVLTPVKKGIIGTFNLNDHLQRILNPPYPGRTEIQSGGRTLRVGDKVMQIRNNYEREWLSPAGFKDGTGIFNGDIGFISDIDEDNGNLTVLYDDIRYVQYELSDLDELELAYAMTIHKSQGSEFPVVVMPAAHFPPMLANRNLLYTGITRAKKGLVLVGSLKALYAVIDNNSSAHRNTGLCEDLRKSLAMGALE